MKKLIPLFLLIASVAWAAPPSGRFNNVTVDNGLTLGGERFTAWPTVGVPDNLALLRGDNGAIRGFYAIGNPDFTDNLTVYGKDVTGDNTGRVQGFSIGSSSYTDNGYFADLIAKGPWADVRWKNAVCDNTTNNDTYIQSSIDCVVSSGKNKEVLIPGGCLYTKSILTKGVSVTSKEAPIMVNNVTWTGSGLNAGMPTDGEWLAVTEYTDNMVSLLHLADKRNPVSIRRFSVGGNPRHCQFVGRYLFVANHGSSSITIYDVSSPASGGTLVATISTAASPKHFIIVGYYLYVVCASGTLQKWDISNLSSITLSASHAITGATPLSVSHYKGILSVVGLSSTLAVFPTNLSNEFTLTLDGTTHGSIEMVGSYGLVTDTDRNKLVIVDLTSPAAPFIVTSIDTSADLEQITVVGDRAYAPSLTSAGTAGKLDCFDITNIKVPYKYKTIPLNNSGSAFTAVAGKYMYVSGHFSPNTIDVVELESPDDGRKVVTQPSVYENNYLDARKPYLTSVLPISYAGKYRTVIANTTLLSTDYIIRAGLNPTITLPDPTGMPDGQEYIISNVGVGTVTIANAYNGWSGTIVGKGAVRLMPSLFSGTYQWDNIGGIQ